MPTNWLRKQFERLSLYKLKVYKSWAVWDFLIIFTDTQLLYHIDRINNLDSLIKITFILLTFDQTVQNSKQ